MSLDIKNFTEIVISVIIVIILSFSEGSAHEGQHMHNEGKQTRVEPSGSTYQLPVINSASDFVLVDRSGERVSLKNLKEKIKIVNFIYTSCPTSCPITLGKLFKLQEILIKKGLLREKVEMISITLDPERDNLEKLKKYANGFNADSNGWLFLRGTKEKTEKVLSDYDIWTKRLEDGTIDHVMRIYLIDDKDRIREIYNLAFLQPELVVRDIEMILLRLNI